MHRNILIPSAGAPVMAPPVAELLRVTALSSSVDRVRNSNAIVAPSRQPTAVLPAYTELSAELSIRSAVAQTHFDFMSRYAEDTHPDSIRMIESKRPSTLPPSYHQAMEQALPMPEHSQEEVEHDDLDPITFSPHLSEVDLEQANRHVDRLFAHLEAVADLTEKVIEAEQNPPPSSITKAQIKALADHLVTLCRAWGDGSLAGSSRAGTAIGRNAADIRRATLENTANTLAKEMLEVAGSDFRKSAQGPMSMATAADIYRSMKMLFPMDL